MLKVVKITLISILSLLVLLIGGGFIVAMAYEKEVKQYIIGEINKQLNVQVIIAPENIDLTLIRNFPYASLEFKHLKALDASTKEKKDTLLSAGNISLQFNAMDIFKKNYHIKKIALQDVALKLWVDRHGNDNYHFWRSTGDSSNKAFAFALEKVSFENIHISYLDYRSKQDISLTIKSGKMKGDFSDIKYSLVSDADMLVEHFNVSDVEYLDQKQLGLALELDVNDQTYNIKKCNLLLNKLKLNSTGTIIAGNEKTEVDVTVKGKDMDIESTLSLLPEKFKSKVKDYSSDGNFYFVTTVKGTISKKETPGITAKFGIENGTITHKNSSVSLKKVNLKGLYVSNEGSDHLNIEPFTAQLKEGTVEGKFELNDFSNPRIDMRLKADLKLDELQKFIALDTIASVAGTMNINASYAGRLPKSISSVSGKKYLAEDLKNAKTSGELVLNIESLRLKENSLEFNAIKGNFLFDDNDMVINDFSGHVSGSDFELKGYFRNILAYLFTENQDLTIDATLRSKKIDLDELLQNKKITASRDTSYELRFSEYLNLNLLSEVQELSFRKFKANNITGSLKLHDKKLVADPIRFETMDGEMLCSGMIDASPGDKVLITCDASLRKINARKLFSQLENFGQNIMEEKNIEGIVTSEIQFASVWKPNLTLDPNKLYARANVTIEKGELINFEPMKALSRFIKIADLERIKFSTLHNEIEIKEQKIYIPQMEIKSSALNVTCSGVHTFKNEIDYKFKLLLNDLLASKAKKSKKENDEFGLVEDDGLGKITLFLSMTGTVEKPIIRYDKKSAVQKLKQDMKEEKHTLKSILHDEFGWFKKDSTLTKKKLPNKEEDKKFKIKWDESEKKEEKKKDGKDEDF